MSNSNAGTSATDRAVFHMTREPDSVRREGHDGRMIVARWTLRVNDDLSQEIAALYVSHWPGKYRASLNRTQWQAPREGSPFSCETSSPMAAIEVVTEPCKRYNAKNHVAFVRKAVALINDPDNAARFAHKFDATIPAAGH
jgi:hypothetical protein